MPTHSQSDRSENDELWEAALTQAFRGQSADSSWSNPLESHELEDGRYQLLKPLGRGAMGEVFEALDTRLGRRVAVKFLSPEALEQPHSVERFDAELRICAGLEHPGLVPVHDAGLTDAGQPWFAMRKITGRTLSAWLRDERLRSRESALLILRRVAESVGFAHHQGIVHRDLKPDNIMIGEDSTVYVTDWGLACRESLNKTPRGLSAAPQPHPLGQAILGTGGSHAGLIVGTKGYMAPEQASGDRDRVGPWTDVFALGMIARELLDATGDRQSDSYLQPLLDRASARDPGDRYPDAAAFALALEKLQLERDEDLRATESFAQQLKVKQLADRRLRRRTALFLAVLTAVVGVLLWLGIEKRDRERRKSAEEAQSLALLSRELELVSEDADRQLRDPKADLNELILQLRTLNARVNSLDTKTIAPSLHRSRFQAQQERFQDALSSAELQRSRQIAVDRFRESFDEFLVESGRIGAWPRILPGLVSGLQSLGIRVGADPSPLLNDENARPLILEALDVWLSILLQSGSDDEETRRWLTEVLEREDPGGAREDLRRALALGDLESLLAIAQTKERQLSLPMTFVLHSALVARGERSDSLKLLIEASEANPSDFRLHLFLAEAFTSKTPADPERALRHLTAARALNPGSSLVLAVEGLAHLESGDVGEVDRVIRALRRQEAQRLAAAVASERYLRFGSPEEALQALAEQATVEPRSAVPWVNRGQVLARLDQHEEAERAFVRALELDPQCVPALLNIGRYEVRRGSVDEGLQRIDGALALNPASWRAYRLAANAALDGSRPSQALRYSEQALQIHPRDAWTQTCLARALHGLGRFDEAIAPLLLAIEATTSKKTQNELEAMRQSYEQDAEAIASWRSAIEGGDAGARLRDLSPKTRHRAEQLSTETGCWADLARARCLDPLASDASLSPDALQKTEVTTFFCAGFGLGYRPLDPATEEASGYRERARDALDALEGRPELRTLLSELVKVGGLAEIRAAFHAMASEERASWVRRLEEPQ